MAVVWLGKLVNGDDALFNKFDVPSDSFPVCLEKANKIPGGDPIKQFGVYRTPFSLLMASVNTPEHLRCYFEIIRGSHSQKHYVDIDIDLEDDKFNVEYPHSMEEKLAISEVIVDEYKNAIIKVYPDIKFIDILVFNSNSNKKRSFHIIVDRWYLASCKQNKEFFDKCMEYIPLSHRKYFDNRMYKSIQQFRLFLSTKCGKNRMKMIDSKSSWKCSENITDPNLLLKEIFYASLITLTDNGCVLIPTNSIEEHQFIASRDLDDNEYNGVIRLFRQYSDASSFDIVGLKKGSLITLKRRRSSYCNVCCRNHDHEHPFVYTTFDNNVYFNCRRNDESFLLGNLNDIPTTNNRNNNTNDKEYIPPSVGHTINISPLIDDDIFKIKPSIIRPITPTSVTSNIYEENTITNQEPVKNKPTTIYDSKIEKYKEKHCPNTNNKPIKIDRTVDMQFNKIATI